MTFDQWARKTLRGVALKPPITNDMDVPATMLREAWNAAHAEGVRLGLKTAADYIDETEAGQRASRYRIGDRIRCKFNLWKRTKMRRFRIYARKPHGGGTTDG